MNFNIDIAIVGAFLLINLFVGLGHGQKVRNIKDYALGDRKFSTGALVATIVATWASGSGFFLILSKTYSDGFFFLFAAIGGKIAFVSLFLFLIPRVGEFLGKISIAEAMGDIYGSNVRVITAIAATIGSAGLVAVQFKAFGSVVSYFIGLPPSYAIIISGAIATIYSAFGGIRAVTFTDILQGISFGTIIPLLGFIIWNQFFYGNYSLQSITSISKFDIGALLNTSNNSFLELILLIIYFSMTGISAPSFQRISICSNLSQIRKAFIASVVIYTLVNCAIAWIPVVLNIIAPDIDSNQLLGYIVDTYSFTGLRGLIIVAIVAFAMSTADSYINSSSVLFTHDIYGVFAKNSKNELFIARIFACVLGSITIILSLMETDLLGIIIFANSFYYPLVVPPFFMTVLGFRSSSKSVLIGMMVGLCTTLLWKCLPSGFIAISQNVVGVLFAMLCNAIFLISSHYILKQPGGWIGVKDNSYFESQKEKRNAKMENFKRFLKKFSITNLCNKIAPQRDITYTSLGIYFIVCTITTMYSTQVELLGPNAQLVKVIYPSMLITGTIMAMYPIWPLSIATNIKQNVIKLWYPVAIFYMLIFFSCFFVLVSKFTVLQVALFCINTITAALLLGWRCAVPLILVGFYLSIEFYQHFFNGPNFSVKFGSPEFILIYILLFVSTSIIIFLKPKQEQHEDTEAKVDTLEGELEGLDDIILNLKKQEGEYTKQIADLNQAVTHYSERVTDQAKEIERLGATAQKILNNVNHELRLPVGNVMNFSQMICEGLDKYTPDQLKDLSDEVYKNSTRLSSMILNMLDLATLDVRKINLNKSTENFSELVRDRVKICRNMYLQGKPIKFKLTIEPEILIPIDSNYIKQVVDNLTINAINFSQKGLIEVEVRRQGDKAVMMMRDEGIGIPKQELFDIFDTFRMGSNTATKAEGRGVGLALCKSAVEAHDGIITAESPEGKGAVFYVVLPREGSIN